jgi:hypothetical protein
MAADHSLSDWPGLVQAGIRVFGFTIRRVRSHVLTALVGCALMRNGYRKTRA